MLACLNSMPLSGPLAHRGAAGRGRRTGRGTGTPLCAGLLRRALWRHGPQAAAGRPWPCGRRCAAPAASQGVLGAGECCSRVVPRRGYRPVCCLTGCATFFALQLQALLDQVDYTLPNALGAATVITDDDRPPWGSSSSSVVSGGGPDAMGFARAAARAASARPEDKRAASQLDSLAASDARLGLRNCWAA